MEPKSLEIHPAALAELRFALEWYFQRSRLAAEKFAQEVGRVIALASHSPSRWPLAEHGTRKLVFRRFPFALIYRETATSVQVLAIAHGHRRPGYWKSRL